MNIVKCLKNELFGKIKLSRIPTLSGLCELSRYYVGTAVFFWLFNFKMKLNQKYGHFYRFRALRLNLKHHPHTRDRLNLKRHAHLRALFEFDR